MLRDETGKIAPAGDDPGRGASLLAGRRALILSDGRAGHLAITLGIAEALGLQAEVQPVAPSWPLRLMAPWGPAEPRLIARMLSEPWPAIALGAGRQTVPFIRALKRRSAGRIFTVLGQDPKTGPASADMIWAPEHDALRGANVVTTLTPPHRYGRERLAELRRNVPPDIAALPSPRVALFLGGPGGGYDWPETEIARFGRALLGVARQGGSFLITPSRRTPPALLRAADEATSGNPRILWAGQGENPYPAFLAHADAFIVTADSVNMAGEACATGKPIHVFHPAGGRAKFRRYHAALQVHGATRPLGDDGAPQAGWAYAPLDAAGIVAAEIERRWQASPAARFAQWIEPDI
jgi:mitochondrial fission protein ELM1